MKAKRKKPPGKRKDQLLELINQLSSNEQRYFHLFGQLTPKEKNYQKLFKLLQGRKTYDSGELQKLTNGKMNLPYEKQYLQKMLLRSLRNYHSEATPEITLNEYMTDIEILYTHGMREMSWTILQKAKALAREHELTLQYLLLCNWEHRYLGLSLHTDQLEKSLQSDFGDERSMIHEFENLLDYKFIKFNMLYSMHRKGVMQGKDEIQTLRQLGSHPLLSSEEKAASFKSKMLYYEILIHYNMQLHQWRAAKDAAEKAVDLIEKKPNGLRDYLQTYYVMLCHIANACVVEYDYAGAQAILDKLLKLLDNKSIKIPPKYRSDIFSYTVEQHLVIASIQKKYKEGSDYGVKIIKELEKYGNTIHDGFKSVFNYFMAQFFFHQQKYETAHDYLLEILNKNYHSTRRDFLLGALMMNIMIHFELKNTEVIPSLFIALNRFCKLNKIQSQFVKLFIEMIKWLINNLDNQREVKKMLEQYRIKVEQLNDASTDGIIIGSLDMESWFNRKINSGILNT